MAQGLKQSLRWNSESLTAALSQRPERKLNVEAILVPTQAKGALLATARAGAETTKQTPISNNSLSNRRSSSGQCRMHSKRGITMLDTRLSLRWCNSSHKCSRAWLNSNFLWWITTSPSSSKALGQSRERVKPKARVDLRDFKANKEENGTRTPTFKACNVAWGCQRFHRACRELNNSNISRIKILALTSLIQQISSGKIKAKVCSPRFHRNFKICMEKGCLSLLLGKVLEREKLAQSQNWGLETKIWGWEKGRRWNDVRRWPDVDEPGAHNAAH